MPAVYGKKKGGARAAQQAAWRDVSLEEDGGGGPAKENAGGANAGREAPAGRGRAGSSARRERSPDAADPPDSADSPGSAASPEGSPEGSPALPAPPRPAPRPAPARRGKRNMPYRSARAVGAAADTSASTDGALHDSSFELSAPDASDDSFHGAAAEPAGRRRAPPEQSRLREQGRPRQGTADSKPRGGAAKRGRGAQKGNPAPSRGPIGTGRPNPAARLRRAPASDSDQEDLIAGIASARPPASLRTSPILKARHALEPDQDSEPQPEPSAAADVPDMPDDPSEADASLPAPQNRHAMITSTPAVGLVGDRRLGIAAPFPNLSPIAPLSPMGGAADGDLLRSLASFSLDGASGSAGESVSGAFVRTLAESCASERPKHASGGRTRESIATVSSDPPADGPFGVAEVVPAPPDSDSPPPQVRGRRRPLPAPRPASPADTTASLPPAAPRPDPPTVYKTTLARRFENKLATTARRRRSSVASSAALGRSTRRVVPLSAGDASVEESFATFLTATEDEEDEEERALRAVGLQQLLEACGQEEVLSFEEGLVWEDADGQEHDLRHSLAKIAEATYSEVFSCPLPGAGGRRRGAAPDRERLVVKILPFCAFEGADVDPDTGERVLVNGCGQLEPSAVWTEIACTSRLASVGSGLFGGFHRARVVRGCYPMELVREWNRWDSARAREGLPGSDNWEPDYFPDGQHYLLLFLPYGGLDLEAFPVPSWRAAHSAFWQVCLALAAAEKEARFEHRDLHVGNVLVLEDGEVKAGTGTAPEVFWRDDAAGRTWRLRHHAVRAVVIDYTLARFEGGGRLFYNPLDDEELFRGQGDRQYDVYRAMREATGGEWRLFWPRTNVLWLEYILHKLVHGKTVPRREAAPAEQAQAKGSKGRGKAARGKKPAPAEDADEPADAGFRERLVSLLGEGAGPGVLSCASASEVLSRFGTAWEAADVLELEQDP